MTTTPPPELPALLIVRPWVDPVVESHGFAPRSVYVEACWLGVLGPTATWLYRRLGTEVAAHPNGIRIDTVELSRSLGLGDGIGRHSKLAHAIGRLVRFGIAEWYDQELHVRRAVGPLTALHLIRLGEVVRRMHETMITQRPDNPSAA